MRRVKDHTSREPCRREIKMNAEEIKKAMLLMGAISSLEDADWLTDEYIASQAKIAQPYPSRTDANGQLLSSLDYGNHFYTSNNGARWHWQSGENVVGGNLNCGTNRSWYYDRRVGDSYVPRGKCAAGYDWYEFNIYH